jgi:hypothetical protein
MWSNVGNKPSLQVNRKTLSEALYTRKLKLTHMHTHADTQTHTSTHGQRIIQTCTHMIAQKHSQTCTDTQTPTTHRCMHTHAPLNPLQRLSLGNAHTNPRKHTETLILTPTKMHTHSLTQTHTLYLSHIYIGTHAQAHTHTHRHTHSCTCPYACTHHHYLAHTFTSPSLSPPYARNTTYKAHKHLLLNMRDCISASICLSFCLSF